MAKGKSVKKELDSRKNYEWFIRKADVNKYAGKWIAVENRKVVASETRISKLLEETKQNWPDAAITKVPKRGQIMIL